MIRKKYTFLLISAILIVIMVFTCACAHKETKEEKEPPAEEKKSNAAEKLLAYHTDIMDSAGVVTSNEQIRDYLMNWANYKGIPMTCDDAGNVVYSIAASDGYEGSVPTVIVCPYDYKQYDIYAEPITMALCIAKNNNGTGKLTLVFTPEKGNNYTGIQSLDPGCLDEGANVICLNAATRGVYSLRSGACSTFRFTQSIKKTAPSYTRAYSFTISGIPGGQPDAKIESHLNPIVQLETVLIALQTHNISFELAEFTGGTDSLLYATSAHAVIVIDADKETVFLERMDKMITSFNEQYANDTSQIVFQYEPCQMPSKVIRESDGKRLIGFLFTLLDGVYYKDDNGIVNSLNSISKIRVKGKSVVINSVAYSLDPLSLAEIEENEETLCALSEIGYEKTGSISGWEAPEDMPFADAIRKAYRSVTDKKLSYHDSVATTSAGCVQALKSDLNIISITVNSNILEDTTETLILYLKDNLPGSEEASNQ